jgi:hypothetical protein
LRPNPFLKYVFSMLSMYQGVGPGSIDSIPSDATHLGLSHGEITKLSGELQETGVCRRASGGG